MKNRYLKKIALSINSGKLFRIRADTEKEIGIRGAAVVRLIKLIKENPSLMTTIGRNVAESSKPAFIHIGENLNRVIVQIINMRSTNSTPMKNLKDINRMESL